MNCKPGDLAVTVNCRSHPELNGIPLTVVRAVSVDAWLCSGYEIERVAAQYDCPPHILDRYLRPIRDSDGTDETLVYAGKPQPVEG